MPSFKLTHIGVIIRIDETLPGFVIVSSVETLGKTGVEMEALTAASIAGLTLYDMLKAIDKTMRLDGLEIVHKSGGKTDINLDA